MQRGNWPKSSRLKQMLIHISTTLSIQRTMLGHIEVAEKPDLLWDHTEFTSLFVKLEAEYEVSERYAALKEKLDLIHKTAETMVGLVQERRTYHVEWYIVILIVIEVVLGLYDRLMGTLH